MALLLCRYLSQRRGKGSRSILQLPSGGGLAAAAGCGCGCTCGGSFCTARTSAASLWGRTAAAGCCRGAAAAADGQPLKSVLKLRLAGFEPREVRLVGRPRLAQPFCHTCEGQGDEGATTAQAQDGQAEAVAHSEAAAHGWLAGWLGVGGEPVDQVGRTPRKERGMDEARKRRGCCWRWWWC